MFSMIDLRYKMAKELLSKRNMLVLTGLSFLACGLHSAMLYSPFNQYAYTSALKVILFVFCQHMIIRRFVSWSGDGIEKCVWGREALAWSVTVRCVKKPCLAQHKIKRPMLMG